MFWFLLSCCPMEVNDLIHAPIKFTQLDYCWVRCWHVFVVATQRNSSLHEMTDISSNADRWCKVHGLTVISGWGGHFKNCVTLLSHFTLASVRLWVVGPVPQANQRARKVSTKTVAEDFRHSMVRLHHEQRSSSQSRSPARWNTNY